LGKNKTVLTEVKKKGGDGRNVDIIKERPMGKAFEHHHGKNNEQKSSKERGGDWKFLESEQGTLLKKKKKKKGSKKGKEWLRGVEVGEKIKEQSPTRLDRKQSH